MPYDVPLTAARDLPVGATLRTGLAAVAQRVETRLRLFLGEYVADRRVGLPYLDWVTQKPPDVAEIGATVRAEIEGTPGVARVEEFTASFSPTARRLQFTGKVFVADNDEALRILVAPFGLVDHNRAPLVAFGVHQAGIRGIA